MPDIRKSFTTPDPIIGTPEEDALDNQGAQSYPDTCAIRCQEYIIERFTGLDQPESYYVDVAEANGWYTPGGGTPVECMGNLLEAHGIAVNRYDHASVFHLANELAQGHKVMIAVDSGELWEGSIFERSFDLDAGVDHAIVVTGIDTSNPDDIRVIVSDPGTGEADASYPLDQFLDAWKDGGFSMVATADPAPPSLPEMSNFDYGLGHLPAIGAVSYDQFLEMEYNPDFLDYLFPEEPGTGFSDDTFAGEAEGGLDPLLPDLGFDDPLAPLNLDDDDDSDSSADDPSSDDDSDLGSP